MNVKSCIRMQQYTEEEILATPRLLSQVSTLLDCRRFSLEFLEKTTEWYDSWVCLRSQPHLTPAFCFRYLYDNGTDSADNWTDCADIERYFARYQPSVLKEEIEKACQDELKRRALAAAAAAAAAASEHKS